jgi:hypothetical protein
MQTDESQIANETTATNDQQAGCGPKAEPTKEHRWLQKLVGEWTCVTEAAMAPDQPMMQFESQEVVRSIGDVWVVGEGTGETPGGGTATTIITLGYDADKGRFLGTFVGSMMTHMWVYNGSLDADERVLTLDTEGPGMSPGTTAKYKDVIEIKADDHRTLTAQMLGDDGQWQTLMVANYKRKG